ncbi:MAG: L-threonine 3-dehydrogenase [Micrococcales bacterium]|nr:L-threonine 3-dehydrogenase [Micrococcales bacterium]
MKALVKTEAAPGLDLIDVPDPVVGPNDVLIKVLRTGICGTDLHINAWDDWAQRTVPVPLTIGHEFCGRIVELGSEVSDLKVGQLVSGEGHYVCGRCRACLAGKRHLCRAFKGIGYMVTGCYSELFVMPAGNIWVHKPGTDLDVAAIFDPFGNAVHTALQFPCLGEDVLVSGAGPIGIMAALVAQHAGARHVVVSDLSDERLALAQRLGLHDTVNPAHEPISGVFERFSMKEGFDIGLEMSGSGAALRDMIDNMTHGGRIALLGTPTGPSEIDVAKIIFNMLTLQGVTGRQIFETWYAMSVLLENGLDISGVITDRFHYTEYEQAFSTAATGHGGKVVMSWES